MIELHDIRYVRVGASNLDVSVRFAQEIIGLELVGRDGRMAWLRGDDRDHNLCFTAGDPREFSVGFELYTAAALEAAAGELRQRGVEVHRGTEQECVERRVGAFINFNDPSGNSIDLVVRPHHSGRRYFPSRDAGITEFGHIGLNTTDPKRDEVFWTETFNARVSDRIGDAALLRIDPVHHKIAMFPTDKPGVQHINFQVASVDDVMRSWYFLRSKDIEIAFGPGRHPTSTAIFLYFYGPDDIIYEYSHGVMRIEDDVTHVPRQFPFINSSFCMWGAVPNIKEFKK